MTAKKFTMSEAIGLIEAAGFVADGGKYYPLSFHLERDREGLFVLGRDEQPAMSTLVSRARSVSSLIWLSFTSIWPRRKSMSSSSRAT